MSSTLCIVVVVTCVLIHSMSLPPLPSTPPFPIPHPILVERWLPTQ